MDLRTVALIADIHHVPDVQTRRDSAASELLDTTIPQVNVPAPDLGDRINDVAAAAPARAALT